MRIFTDEAKRAAKKACSAVGNTTLDISPRMAVNIVRAGVNAAASAGLKTVDALRSPKKAKSLLKRRPLEARSFPSS